jgi:hypothetical protein
MPKSIVVFSVLLAVTLIVSPMVFPAAAEAGSVCGGKTLASRLFYGVDAEVRADAWVTAQLQTLVGDCGTRSKSVDVLGIPFVYARVLGS